MYSLFAFLEKVKFLEAVVEKLRELTGVEEYLKETSYYAQLQEVLAYKHLEYLELEKRDKFLSALEQAGVDNWSGYSHAYEILEAE